MQTWILPALAIALGVATLVLALALVAARRHARDEVDQARAETDQLRERVAGIEARLAAPASTEEATPTAAEYLITDLVPGAEDRVPAAVPERIDGRLFADLVLRETVVKGASWAHGLRRALEPEARFRMRYAFRSEVRLSRKQRRADLKAARQIVARRRRLGEDVA